VYIWYFSLENGNRNKQNEQNVYCVQSTRAHKNIHGMNGECKRGARRVGAHVSEEEEGAEGLPRCPPSWLEATARSVPGPGGAAADGGVDGIKEGICSSVL